MKLVRVQRASDLESKIKQKFSEFNRTSPPSKGRKYPDDLKALACRALLICIALGMNESDINRYRITKERPSH